jgi:hypothetical protein
MESQVKTCFNCGEEKSLEDFHVDKRSKDGRRGVCKNCRNAASINKLPVEKELSKEEKFIEKCKKELDLFKVKKLNEKFITKMPTKILRLYHRFINPSTNIFKVRACVIPPAPFAQSADYIKSHLSLFLIQKFNDTNINFKIVRGKHYNDDRCIVVILPEEFRLTAEEINDFIKILKGPEENICLVNEVTFSVDEINLSPFCADISGVVRMFLLVEGFDISRDTMGMFMKDDHFIKVTWPENSAISQDLVEKLKCLILEYIVNLL